MALTIHHPMIVSLHSAQMLTKIVQSLNVTIVNWIGMSLFNFSFFHQKTSNALIEHISCNSRVFRLIHEEQTQRALGLKTTNTQSVVPSGDWTPNTHSNICDVRKLNKALYQQCFNNSFDFGNALFGWHTFISYIGSLIGTCLLI